MDSMRTLRRLERAAAVMRRAGLGRLVDRARGPALRGMGGVTVEVEGLRLSGEMQVHSHYLRELVEGGRESHMASLFQRAVPAGGLVVDVGAHLGLFTLLAARAGAEVIAFEPNASTLPHLRGNLAANGVAERVTVVEKAAGARAETRTFHLDAAGDTSSLHEQSGSRGTIEVEVVPGDEAVAGRAVDVIKIDVEGAELEALAGLEGTIAAAGPRLALFVECNPDALSSAGASAEDLGARLEALGLRVSTIDESARTLRPGIELGGAPYVNLYCVRPDRSTDTTTVAK